MSDELAAIAEGHLRAALEQARRDFPAIACDSWSEPAYPGQWVVVQDDEGRFLQAELDGHFIRGVAVRPGSVAGPCRRLVESVLDEIRRHAAAGDTIVSRPLPDPEDPSVYCAHLEFGGVWLRLTAGHDPAKDATMVVLSGLLGHAGRVPLADPEGPVLWL